MPMFFNIGGSERSELRQLRAAGCRVLDEFAELSMWDIVATAFGSIRHMFLSFERLEVRSFGFTFDVGRVFQESHWRTHGAPDLLRLNLAKRTLARLAGRHIKWESLYYPFENNASEKSFILAARDFYPNTQLIGFQHTVVFRDQLSMHLSAKELVFHPLPDRLLCSGPVYIPVLKGLGFPPEICEMGANLRYISIENGQRWLRKSCQGSGVLFVLNYNLDHAYEVLVALAQVVQRLRMEFEDFQLKLKLHPLTDRSDLKRLLGYLGFGDEVVFVEGAVQDEVLASRVTVMTGGSVSVLETLTVGSPLILYSLEQEFDFDCLWPEFAQQPAEMVAAVRTADELYLSVRANLDAPEESSARQIESIRRAYFSVRAPANLKVFLPN